MLQLVFMDQGEEMTYDLAPGVHLVGRGADCQLVLHDKSVSGEHVRIDVRPDGVVEFRDLMSSNGTQLHGRRTDAGELNANDRLRIGRVKVRVVDADHPSALPVARPVPTASRTAAASAAHGMGSDGAPTLGEDEALDTQLASDGTPMAPVPAIPLDAAGDDAAPAAPRALMVMPQLLPAAAGADASSAAGSADSAKARQRKMAIRVGAGVVALILLGVLFGGGNTQKPKNNGPVPPKGAGDYETQIKEGLMALSSGQPEAAIKIWSEADATQRKRQGRPYDSARAFIGVAKTLIAIRDTGEVSDLQYKEHFENLKRVREEEHKFQQETVQLNQRLGRELTYARLFREVSDRVAKAGGQSDPVAADRVFRDIEKKLDEIPTDSMLSARVQKMRKTIVGSRVALLKSAMRRARDAGNHEEELALIRQLRPYKDDPEYRHLVEDDLDLAAQTASDNQQKFAAEKKFLDAGESARLAAEIGAEDPNDERINKTRKAIALLDEAVQRLYPNIPEEHRTERQLDAVRREYEKRRAALAVALVFYQWDRKELEKRLQEPEALAHVELASIRGLLGSLKEAEAGYEDATKRLDFERAQYHVRQILALDTLPPDHPLYLEWKRRARPDQANVAAEMLNNVTLLIDRKEFAEARWQVARAQRLLGYPDPTDLVKKYNDAMEKINAYNRQIESALAGTRAPTPSVTQRIEMLREQVEALREQNAEVIAEYKEKERFLTIRNDLLKRAMDFRREAMRTRNFTLLLNARDFTAYGLNDKEVGDRRREVERLYRERMGREMPPIVNARDESDKDGDTPAPADD